MIPQVLHNFDRLRINAGDLIFNLGQPCRNYIVVLEGMVRVSATSANGKEVVLYRIQPGEVCVLTTSCLLGSRDYPARAIAETVVEACIVNREEFNRLVTEDQNFRHFVFHSFGQRLSDLMLQVELIALESVPKRLQLYLLRQADAHQYVHATHQDIAVEIGSAREVVSRHLKNLEKQNVIRIHRGKIQLLDLDQTLCD